MSAMIRRSRPKHDLQTMTPRYRFSPSLAGMALLATAVFFSPALAQTGLGEVDPEIRVQQLENQLRRLTGQNEELQFRNRQLEEQLRALQGAGPSAAVAPLRPNVAAAPNA